MKKVIRVVLLLSLVINLFSGDGSFADPYTIDEAIENNSGSNVWVQGFIVGTISSTTSQDLEPPFTTATNIAVAGLVDETLTENILAVQLPSGDIRAELNLVDNELNYQKEVKLLGNLQTYYSRAGLKSTSDYEFVGSTQNDQFLYINEMMSDNSSSISDDFGDFDPWIEIYNRSAESIDLEGLYISDDIDNLTKHLITGSKNDLTTIAPKGFALLWLDGEEGEGFNHISFSLISDSGTIFLTDSDGVTIIDQLQFSAIPQDNSYGYETDYTSTLQILENPTPLGENSDYLSTIEYQGFDQNGMGSWSSFDLSGSKNWEIMEYSNNKYAQCSNYQSSGNVNDWLVSPTLNFDNYENEVLTFKSKNGYNFDEVHIAVKLSTDFHTVTSPEEATWVELEANWDPHTGSGYGSWTESGEIDLSSYSGDVTLGFHYDLGDATTTWQIDDIIVKGKKDPSIPNVSIIHPFNNQSFDRYITPLLPISVSAIDIAEGREVSKLSLYFDNNELTSTTDLNYINYQFDISSISINEHTIKSVVEDDLGNRDSVEVNINITTSEVISIHDIQGDSHISPMVGAIVTGVKGVVTGVLDPSLYYDHGFYFQTEDSEVDQNDKTSEAIFVRTGTTNNGFDPAVEIGDLVKVDGVVSEYYIGGYSKNYLSRTEINVNSQSDIEIVSSGNPLPTPTILGNGGRTIPQTIIDNDTNGEILAPAPETFDPSEDGVDFYESVEFMRVQINNALVVAPTYKDRSGKKVSFTVVADNGENVGTNSLNERGGIVITEDDSNPERISLDDELLTKYLEPGDEEDKFMPLLNVGATFNQPIIGIMGYFFLGDFKLYYTDDITVDGFISESDLEKERTELQSGDDYLTIGNFNVENLSPVSGEEKFDSLAVSIIRNLKSPDIIALEEIQDNSGPEDDGVVDADETLTMLIEKIAEHDGPSDYQFLQINPLDNQDGGQPGGNIRVGFLYRSTRVDFNGIAGGDATTPVEIETEGDQPKLSFNPGRIDPMNIAFGGEGYKNSRKPLIAEFVFNSKKVFVIAVHFSSKAGDDAIYGRVQPPILHSGETRTMQVEAVRALIEEILAIDSEAFIVAAGDFNDFHYSEPMESFTHNESGDQIMNDLVWDLDILDRYSYNWGGNMQILDHITISNGIKTVGNYQYDIIHMNSEFGDQFSDHDPEVLRFGFEPVDIEEGTLPTKTAIYQNYPNPFNPETTIKFDMANSDFVEISLYNSKGEMVKSILKNSFMEAGRHSLKFSGEELPSGIYYYKFISGSSTDVRKAVLIK